MESRSKTKVVRLVVILPLFLILIGLGVGCENSLMLDDKSVSPDYTSSSNDLMSSSLLSHFDQTQLDSPVTINCKVMSVEGSNYAGSNITFSGLVTTCSGFGVNTVFRSNMEARMKTRRRNMLKFPSCHLVRRL